MNVPLLVFLSVAAVFSLSTLYTFSRLRQIRIEGDASKLAMTSHVVASGLIILMTLLFLLQL